MEIKKINCSIVAGAPNADVDYLKNAVDKNSFIIAADSGYVYCKEAGIVPDIIIGDFDSSRTPDTDIEFIKLPVMKDDTDTFSTIKYAVSKGFKQIEIFNAVGNRFDHTYSNTLCLKYCVDNNVEAHIIDRHNKISLVKTKIVITPGNFKYFSVFAYGCKAEGLTIKNALYELTNRDIDPYVQYTQSNEFRDLPVEISIKNGILMLVQSND